MSKSDKSNDIKFILSVNDGGGVISPKDHLLDYSTEQLHNLIELVKKEIKRRSMETPEIDKKWKNFKKLMDTKLKFINSTGEDQFWCATLKSKQYRKISEDMKKKIPEEMKKFINPVSGTKDANLYIAHLGASGLPNSFYDIVYVGEVRKDKTGLGYRSVMARWGYSGHDHGAEVRGIIKETNKDGKTRIDQHIASFDFDSGDAHILITKGEEAELIKLVKRVSRRTKWMVVNK